MRLLSRLRSRILEFISLVSIANKLMPHTVLIQACSAILAASANVVSAFFLGAIINRLLDPAPRHLNIIGLVIAYLACVVGLQVMNAIVGQWAGLHARLLNSRAQASMSQQLLAMDYATFMNSHVRALYSSVRAGFEFTGGFQMFMQSIINDSIEAFVTMLYAGSTIWIVFTSTGGTQTKLSVFVNSWVYLLCLLILVISPLFLSREFSRRAGEEMQEFFSFNTVFNRRLDYYTGFIFRDTNVNKLLRVFDPKQSYWRQANQEVVAGIKRDSDIQLRVSAKLGYSMIFTQTIVGIIYFLLSLKAVTGAVSIGAAIACAGTLQVLIVVLGDLFRSWGNRAASFTTMHDYQEFMGISSVSDKGQESGLVGDTIEFRDVSFRYPGQARYALRHVSLTIRPGERIALVGKNGSGKTTLVKLLNRLITPDEGVILVDGVDINTVDLNEYRSLFATVSQSFFSYAGTVAENISMTDSGSITKLEDAVNRAGLQDRIVSLPDELSTFVTTELDERGVNFSGGELQKIAIARAIYKNAKIYILDEPTSALDPTAEEDIFNRLNEVTRNNTTVFISHRMSSTRLSDKIFVMDKGRIVESGSHSQLMSREGIYFQLYTAQANYFEGDLSNSIVR